MVKAKAVYPETYLEITNSVIPPSCVSGGNLVASITVRNKHTEALLVRILGGYNTVAATGSPVYAGYPASANIAADGVQVFTCTVPMPAENIVFFTAVYYYGDDDVWHGDDLAQGNVVVTGVVVPAETGGIGDVLTSIMPLIMIMMVMMMLMPMFKGMSQGFE